MTNALVKIDLNLPVKSEEGCKDLIANFYKQLVSALPNHIPIGVMTSAILNSFRQNEMAFSRGKTKHRLSDCTGISLLSAMVKCAETGLIPDGAGQECHLIPFAKQVTWMGGYRGFTKLALQSGRVSEVETAVVYKNDDFKYHHGLHQDLRLVEAEGDRGEMIKVYAAIFPIDPNGRPRFEVMGKGDVDKIRASAPGRSSDAWVNWYDEMARKTVLKRLLKTAPLSPQLATALDEDNRLESKEGQELHMKVQELVESAINARKPATQRLTDELKAKNGNGQAEPTAETVEPPREIDEAKEAAIKEVLELATDNEPVVRAKVLDKCTEDNLRGMQIESIGVLKQEILDDIKKAKAKLAKA